MAWNRPNEAAKVAPKKNPSVMRGMIAGLIIVGICVGIFIWWGADGIGSTKKTRIQAPQLDAQETSKDSCGQPQQLADRSQKPMMQGGISSLPEEDASPMGKSEVERAQTNNTYVVQASTNRIFKSGLEQVLNMIFNTQIGDFPGPLPRIHKNEEENLAGILVSANRILESDDECVREKKEQVNFAKKELAKFIKDGGSYQEFLRYYHDELVKAFRERKAYQRTLDEFSDDEGVDASMVREYHKKINEKLAEKGIRPIELPEEYQDED